MADKRQTWVVVVLLAFLAGIVVATGVAASVAAGVAAGVAAHEAADEAAMRAMGVWPGLPTLEGVDIEP